MASGLRDARWHVTIFPLVLNTLSDGERVAGTHGYFLRQMFQVWEYFLVVLPPLQGIWFTVSANRLQVGRQLFESAPSVTMWQRVLFPFLKKLLRVVFFGGFDTVGASWGCEAADSVVPWSDSITSSSDMALHLISSTFSSAMYVDLNLESTNDAVSSRLLVAGSANFSLRSGWRLW